MFTSVQSNISRGGLRERGKISPEHNRGRRCVCYMHVVHGLLKRRRERLALVRK